MEKILPLILSSNTIFAMQFSVMLLVNVLVARWYVLPWLRRVSIKEALTPLLLLHVTRVIGLVFVVNAVTDPTLPRGIAYTAAGGDFAAAMLSLIALAMVRKDVKGANVLVVIANIVGLCDLLLVASWGVPIGFPNYQLGAAWFIPTFIGPSMMVSHALMLWLVLVRSKHE